MCFNSVQPRVYEEYMRTAKKTHRCCECRLPIHPGERYQDVFGVWDGEADQFKTCSTCLWFRERLVSHELEVGCSVYESYPGFGELWEAVYDEPEAIDLFDLLRKR